MLTRPKTIILASVVIIILATTLILGTNIAMQPENTVKETNEIDKPQEEAAKSGKSYLNIKLRTVDGEEITIGEILSKEKPVVLYFFTTWCPTCRNDLKNLKSVYDEFRDSVEVLVVGFDFSETAEEIREYAVRRGYYGEWIFTEPSGELISAFKVTTMASKIVISTDGEIVYREGYGVVDEDKWRSILSMAVGEAAY